MGVQGGSGLASLLVATALGVALWQGRDVLEQVPEHMTPPPGHGPYTGTVADWPLWFPMHKFGAYCFDTLRCEVRYAGFQHGGPDERSQPSIESFGRPIEDILRAGWGPYPNFPEPARVTWTSLDGTALVATVDVAGIFSDRMVRHTMAREDILENATIPYPGIIVVVDDRVIRVYMSSWIVLKESRGGDSENRASDLHTGVVLVHSETY